MQLFHSCLRKQLIITFLTTIVVNFSWGQYTPAEVKISNEKTIIDGVFYYLHTVKEGQTFFSICKAYQIAKHEVLKVNPGLIPGQISVNQVIKIPILKEIVEKPIETQDFIYHTVKPGETLFALQSIYGISVDEIKKQNPDITNNNIPVGQIIKIAKQTTTEQVFHDSLYHRHVVKQDENIWQISLQYKVPIHKIILANENLRNGLRPGQLIMIPKTSTFEFTKETIADSTIQLSRHKFTFQKCDSIKQALNINKIRVAVLLPFGKIHEGVSDTTFFELADSISVTEKEIVQYSAGMVEYYEGLLVAADSMRKKNIDIQLITYNTADDSFNLSEKLKKLEFLKPDIIIGPVKESNIQLVSDFAKLHGIIHVLPFNNNKKHLKDHPTCFQLLPQDKDIEHQTIEYLASLKNADIFYIYKNDTFVNEKVSRFDTVFQQLSLHNNHDSINVRHVFINDSTFHKLYNQLSVEQENILIPFFKYNNGNDEPDVIGFYSILYNLRSRYKFSVVGNYVWQTFQNLRIEPYHDFRTHINSPFYIDYSKQRTLDFANMLYSKLGYEPYRTVSSGMGFNFAFLGFETGMVFLNAYKNYGNQLTQCHTHWYNSTIQSNYKFKQVEGGLGFYNASYTIMVYDEDNYVKIIEKE